jgi:membrane fusion protein (multidrug efflux system)
MELVDDDPLRVEFELPEEYLGRVELGSPVAVVARSLPGREISGRVAFVSPRVESATRTLKLEAEVPNAERLLRPGQFVDVQIELERRPEAVVVPEEAVVPRGGENFVFVVADGTAELRQVTLGERAPGRVEVASGLEAGERVVVAGQQKIQDGAAVEATLRPISASEARPSPPLKSPQES